jgi:hypothetical protein
MRVGRVERLRRETIEKQMKALRKLAQDRLVVVNALRSELTDLQEESRTAVHKARLQTNRLNALKALLVKLGNDDIGVVDTSSPEPTTSIH